MWYNLNAKVIYAFSVLLGDCIYISRANSNGGWKCSDMCVCWALSPKGTGLLWLAFVAAFFCLLPLKNHSFLSQTSWICCHRNDACLHWSQSQTSHIHHHCCLTTPLARLQPGRHLLGATGITTFLHSHSQDSSLNFWSRLHFASCKHTHSHVFGSKIWLRPQAFAASAGHSHTHLSGLKYCFPWRVLKVVFAHTGANGLIKDLVPRTLAS